MTIPQPEDAEARLLAGFRAGDVERSRQPAAAAQFHVGRLLRKVTDLALVRPAAYLVRRLGFRQDVITRVRFLAAEDSARYVLDKMMPCAIFDNRYELFDLAIRNAPPQGLLLEFGVFNGKSINYISKRIGERHIFGFDSFEGLAEDWGGTGLLKGAFNVGGRMPKVGRNATLVRGWFQDTLPPFLDEHPGPIAFANLDADTYEATTYVLGAIADRLAVGTVLQFDEYLGYPGWRTGEYLALANFCKQHGVGYRYLGVGWMSVAVQITAIRS
jgi:Macrocin-O-methyltransferase (TylF)